MEAVLEDLKDKNWKSIMDDTKSKVKVDSHRAPVNFSTCRRFRDYAPLLSISKKRKSLAATR